MTTPYSFNSPVTSPQYAALREPHYQADLNISLVDNVLAFSAQLNATLPTVTGATTAVLTYTSAISGSYTNIDEGMVVIVSPTSDPRYPTAVRLRARLDGVAGVVADSSHVYVNEYSYLLGLGSYIFVYYAYDLIDSLSRPTGTSPSITQLMDYNQSFQTMAPVIRGADATPLQLGYADWVDSAGHFDIAFAATGSFSPQSGATISAYQYSVVPTGSGVATVVAGNAATASVTYQFTAGEYWVKLVVTDSLGVTNFRHMLVKAHSDAYPPQEGFEGAEITRDIAQGPSVRVKYYDNVSSLINGTLAIGWMKELYSQEDFSSSSTSLFGNIAFVGWIETEEDEFQTDPTYSAYSTVQFEIQGVGARLARIEGQLLAITNSASPSAWDQIKNLTPWRAVVHFLQRHTQALHLCDFTADSLTDAFKFPTLTTIAGNGLDNVSGDQGIAWQVRSALAFARDGRILMETRADFDPTFSTDLTHVATWQNQDIVGDAKLKINQYVQYGFVNADGACWDGTSATPIPFLARAPGLAQASGVDQGQFNNQILTSGQIPAAAQAQLNGFSGTMYAIDDNTTEMTITHPDGYWWLETSLSQLYVFDGLTFAVRGIILDANTYWMIKTVTHSFDNKTGSGTVTVVYIPVVSGTPGATVPIINNTSLTPPPIIPPIPAFNFELPETTIPDPGLPSSPITPPTTDHNGQIVLEISASGEALAITQNYILLAAPTWRTYAPPLPTGYILQDAIFDQLGSTAGAVAVYALASTGTASAIFYNPNILSGSSSWSQTASPVPGKYTQIRASGTPGSVLIYAPAPDSGTGTVNFTYSVGTGPANANIGDIVTVTSATDNPSQPFATQQLGVTFDQCARIGPITVGNWFEWHCQNMSCSPNNAWAYGNCAGGLVHGPVYPTTSTPADIPPHICTDQLVASAGTTNTGGDGTHFTLTFVLEELCDPGGHASVRQSTDYGVTIGSDLSLSTSAGVHGGFDLTRNSGTSYGAAHQSVKKASSLGGAYSNFITLTNNPSSICIPYYQVGSDTTVQTASSTPQVVVGLEVETSGTCLIWLDGSATPTNITTPASGAIIDGPERIAMLRGTKIAVIVNVSGQEKLYVSENLAAGGSATWTFVKNVGSTATLRSRRNDPRTGSHKGQLFLFDDTSGYSSKWANASEWARVSPTSDIMAGDILG